MTYHMASMVGSRGESLNKNSFFLVLVELFGIGWFKGR